MNKSEFIRSMAEKAGCTRAIAEANFDAFIDTITDALKEGDKIQLVGFGTFEIKDVPAKTGINPLTQEKVDIPASKKPSLKFGNSYKEKFN